MTTAMFMCFIYGIVVGEVGVNDNENIFKVLLASFLGSCAIVL